MTIIFLKNDAPGECFRCLRVLCYFYIFSLLNLNHVQHGYWLVFKKCLTGKPQIADVSLTS